MSFTDPPDEPPEVDEEARRLMQEKAELLEHAAHKIGLHATSIVLGFATNPETGQPGGLVLMANFAIGDLAFNDRVQDPAKDAVSDELAKIEHDFTIQQIEDLRDRMRGSDGTDTGEADSTEA